MLPEKLYTYVESDDCIVCLQLTNEWGRDFEGINFYIGEYQSPTFKTDIEFDDEEIKNCEYIYDEHEFIYFKSLKEAENLREQITLEKYFKYKGRLYCKPKYEE